jgi:hypothetical protein
VLAVLAVCTLTGAPAETQALIDIAGQWQARAGHEDQPHRAPGPELGDLTGLPINNAARRKADTWDASILSQPEQQAKPHPAQYSMRGPGPNMHISEILDQRTGRLVAYRLAGMYGRADRTIWMDGRAHPSAYAEHTFDGFSTGRWVNEQLVVTTTHMKAAFIQRNGVPASAYTRMTEYFVRHGDHLLLFAWIDDPIYLEEPMVWTSNWVWNPRQTIGIPIPFNQVDELGDKPVGWVPSYPLGTEHREFADRFNLPFEATRGGRASMYPEYMAEIERLRASEAAERAR